MDSTYSPKVEDHSALQKWEVITRGTARGLPGYRIGRNSANLPTSIQSTHKGCGCTGRCRNSKSLGLCRSAVIERNPVADDALARKRLTVFLSSVFWHYFTAFHRLDFFRSLCYFSIGNPLLSSRQNIDFYPTDPPPTTQANKWN